MEGSVSNAYLLMSGVLDLKQERENREKSHVDLEIVFPCVFKNLVSEKPRPINKIQSPFRKLTRPSLVHIR